MLLLIRQWLGWTYVHKRLLSERVEYEESGWYDGQVWEKPLSWRERDLLLAQHEVRPILGRLGRAMATTRGSFLVEPVSVRLSNFADILSLVLPL